MKIPLTINGRPQQLQVAPGETLLDALRSAGYNGVKRGCEAGTCGSCVVLVNGKPHYSCLLFAAGQVGHDITTIESLGTHGEPHPIVQAFAEEGAVQCGYCIPGMVLTTQALLDDNPQPTEEQAKEAIDGHLCRCTGYVKQIRAILRAADLMHAQAEKDG